MRGPNRAWRWGVLGALGVVGALAACEVDTRRAAVGVAHHLSNRVYADYDELLRETDRAWLTLSEPTLRASAPAHGSSARFNPDAY